MYNVLYDTGQQLCFVGYGTVSNLIFQSFKKRDAISISLEDLEHKDQEWFNKRQFIVMSSDVSFKIRAVEFINSCNGHFFSLVHKENQIDTSTKIGYGCHIECYNSSLPNDRILIGNHCCISSFILLGHHLTVEDYCHISSHSHVGQCRLGKGTVVGVNSFILGTYQTPISIADFTNILMGSTVVKSIVIAGTYYGNRLSSSKTSLIHRIL